MAPAMIGIAVVWLVLFVIVIHLAPTTSYGEALQDVLTHLN